MPAPILGLRTTIYKVADLEKAKQWYAEAFDLAPYFDEPFYVGFNVAGYELGLMQEDIAADSKTANVLSYWGVEDIDQAVARFIELGASADTEPANVGGEIMVASVKDPWGNVIGLIYNPEFELP
ncbi:MAG: VOC family protein [Rhodospirillales bacterium]|jgi:lactoylglutathione lyase|nr:glyoxalase/bleomycin resistance/extradiol dioxygenase family protein [Rhodospirillaceae bacterium]MDP6429526.1 VOC family protein [Rhodospirillales bacterium]MDP6646331.1 VOC family protein [Rhodospirillales bacterium]MDP6842684.1 VOC family protein [Rhodospirillales bacterium]|tara:strand:+ start:2601 stop:2975 length:375 start_codon:yes stop_codon:yes gene_type:complete